MNRHSDMLQLTVLAGLVLLFTACGGEPSVASKSAAAYREAQEKGIPIAGGHDHGGHSATDTSAHAGMDHSAHGTAPADAHAGMDHSAHGTAPADAHAGMDHGSTGAAAADHIAHGAATSAMDHAAMGHGRSTDHGRMGRSGDAHAGHTTARAANDHRGHTAGTAAVDHAEMGHATSAQHRTSGRAADPHAGHTTAAHETSAAPSTTHAQHAHPATPSAPVDHSAHAAVQPAAGDPHAGHGSSPLPPVEPEAPRTNAAIAGLAPASTLHTDRFDAAVPISVAEAVKAAQGGGHEGHDTRWITPGEDHANPPTPMPAVRTRANTEPTAPAVDHSQHGASAPSPQAAPDAAVVYVCPMHPDVTSDKPGTCPKCGMALVRKK